MGKKKYIAVVACMLAASIIFAGCGSSTSSSTANDNGNVIYGKVTAIDGKSITIALAESDGKNDGQPPQGNVPNGEQPQGSAPSQPSGAQKGQQPQGNPPAQPSGAANGQQPQGNPPAQPSGAANGQQSQGSAPAQPSGAPSGQQPQGNPPAQPSGARNGQQPQGGGLGGSTLTGEIKTITVTDNTVITTSSFGQNTTTKAALSDIKVDSILSISMAGNTVTTITIMSAGGGNQGAAPSTSTSPAESSSAAVKS